MGIDVIDVLILHRSDHLMDPDATAEALDNVIKQGKVRHIGVSNFLPSRFDLLQSRLKAPIVTNQVQFSPLYLQAGQRRHLRPGAEARPQADDLVAGRRRRPAHLDRREDRGIRNLLTEIALRMGLPGPAEAAMAFVARHPVGGMPIVGSGKRERVDGAIQAVNAAFARDDWYEVVGKSSPWLEVREWIAS